MTELYPVVILAGGLSMRLRPLTENVPKSMLLIKNEPFIAHQLRLLKKNNIQKVIICIGFLGELIQEFVQDGSRFGLEVTYVKDGTQLLGTGGAIREALPYLPEHFFVLYGDSYLTCDFAAVQAAYDTQKKLALMTVFCNKNLWDKSNILFRENKIMAYNKSESTADMHYIDYGLGIMSKLAFTYAPKEGPYDLVILYQTLLKQDQLAGYEVKERFYEAGSFSGLKELEEYLVNAQIG